MMAPAFITRTAGPRGRIKALDHHHGADLTLSIDNFNEQELSPCPRMCRAGVLLRLWLPLVAWTIPACAGPTLVDLGVYPTNGRFSFSLTRGGQGLLIPYLPTCSRTTASSGYGAGWSVRADRWLVERGVFLLRVLVAL